jgi:phenylacetate-coenzyme A ligase PaaK-like adenylate-forming protein
VHGVVVYSEDEFATWVAAHLPVLARFGVGPGTRLAAIGAPSPIHLSKQLFAALQPPGAPPSRLSVATPLDELVAALNTAQPEALIGYASVMGLLAQEQLDGRLGIEPRTVVTGAELLTEDAEQRIGAAWGVRAFQVYATTEAPIVAASSAGADALEVPRDLVVVEVVDERNRPVQPGEPGHKVLLTNLVNRVQPLIRYELTDSLRQEAASPDHGHLRATVEGRADDVLHYDQVQLHPHVIRSVLVRHPEITEHQVVQTAAGIHASVVAAEPGAGVDLPALTSHLTAALAEAGLPAPEVAADQVPQLSRDPGTGKLRRFIPLP